MSEQLITVTFYKFVNISDIKEMRLGIYKFCKDHSILGTILLANEGINATLSGLRESIDAFYKFINTLFSEIEYKESSSYISPFAKLKVKIKNEIIRFEVDDLDPSKSGVRLGPDEWEKLLDSGAKVIDTRNDYEIAFGTFKNACNPKTRNFTDLVGWLDEHLKDHDPEQPIGMCCTGGIRCEKSTAYLLKKGFKKVYHLDGGIIKYLANAKRKYTYWKGRCFVFDDRIALDHNLQPYNTVKGS